MDVAIVGCGHIASAYADGLAAYADLSLVATADTDVDRAARLADAHGAAPYPSAEAMLADCDAPLVVNLTIHNAHAPVTRTCLDAGRHVLSEKPLAIDPAEARALVDLADRHGLALGCAPISGWADAQQQAAQLVRDGHLGPVRMAYATGNFGRMTEWNANPEPFLRIGPLYDGAVYPLTVLTTMFGPVARVHTADAALLQANHEHDGRSFSVDTPDHVTAVLEMEGGPRVQLTASMYVPYQTRHFSSLELHGDAGSLYLNDIGNFSGATDAPLLQVARLGQPYRPLPMRRRPAALTYAAAVADVAQAAQSGDTPRASGRQAAHLVAAIDAITESARTHAPVPVDAVGFTAPALLPWTRAAAPHRTTHPLDPQPRPFETTADLSSEAIELPPVGFGCSRYRGGTTYVDLDASMADALAAGYRLFDTAELYGTEAALGALLQDSAGPPREHLHIVGKAWNTNHRPDHLRAAAEASLERLCLDAFDTYMLHGPDAWAHQGALGDVSALSHEEATALTFPTDAEGTPRAADVTLAETWAAMETLVRDGLAQHLGICNASKDTLAELLETAEIPPRVLQIECHPYHHPADLIAFAHDHDLRVMAHSPLSAPGLLTDDTVQRIAAAQEVSAAQVVLRWSVQHGLVPIPSSTNPDHVHANADLFGFALSGDEIDALDALHQPEFSR